MRASLSLDELVALGRHRWAVALLADLDAHRGARFVELVHRLALPRDSLARTLEAAVAAGWVMRNPGHGHPLRPEYLLTPLGKRLAAGALSIATAQVELGLGPGALTRWGMPLIRAIGPGEARFNELARVLAPATPRALSQGLQSLAANELVARDVVDGWPPASLYRLTAGGLRLAKAA
ncbi:MAG: winged helix-turn-helix transcriptional regulator [Rubrivivax sp.]|nr:winged helix-turn-helix transcriptional regulator [Rubrivivax sp.]